MENESRRKDVSILIILSILFFLLVQVSSCFNSNQGNSLSGDNENPVPPDEYKNNPDRKSKEIISFPESIKTYTIGESVKGMPLTVTEIGLGNKTGLVITGAIHGNEKNTKTLVEMLEAKYIKNDSLIPLHVRLFFLPVINPDGLEKRTRRNEHNVDLNRNFPTDDWKPDAVSPSGILAGSGGSSPGSEPEVLALIEWLEMRVKQVVDRIYLISFHSAYPPTGSVQPGYLEYGRPGPESKRFAAFISDKAGYKYLQTWITSLKITGEFIHWCEMNNIWSCDIELPDYHSPSTIPAGKNETTHAAFERTIQELLHGFFVDSDDE